MSAGVTGLCGIGGWPLVGTLAAGDQDSRTVNRGASGAKQVVPTIARHRYR